MLWLIIITLAAAGLIAAAIGFRGRRINDHPICRGCGFDLVGLAGGAGEGGAGNTDLGAGQTRARCPECGRELTDRRIRAGARRRRRWMIALGALLLLIAAGWGGGLGWSGATSFDWNAVKPTWLLMLETRQPTGHNAAAGMRELVARLEASRLSREQVDALIARILEVQGDENARWHASWGDIVQAAHAAGALSEDALLRYARQAVQGVLAPAESKVLGGRFLYGLELRRPARAGTRPGFYLQPVLRTCRINGVERSIPGGGGGFIGLSAGNAGSLSSLVTLPFADGEHELEFIYDLNIVGRPEYDEIEPLASWSVTYTDSVTVGGQ